MIEQLTSKPALPTKLRRRINRLKPATGSIWNTKKEDIKRFKRLLKEQLKKIQHNKCSFCGLKLDETSASQIEHFAPKGGDNRIRHPEFTFTILNLTLACSLCNGFNKKGNLDTVITKSRSYQRCVFNIVHPYLDDPSDHYSWSDEDGLEGILISEKTSKGKNSIKVFNLDSSEMTEARTKDTLLKGHQLKLSSGKQEQVAKASTYRPDS